MPAERGPKSLAIDFSVKTFHRLSYRIIHDSLREHGDSDCQTASGMTGRARGSTGILDSKLKSTARVVKVLSAPTRKSQNYLCGREFEFFAGPLTRKAPTRKLSDNGASLRLR